LTKKNTVPEWMSDATLAEYIDRSAMTIWRFDNLPAYAELNFPKPAIVNGQKYRSKTEIDAWMRSRVSDARAKRKAKGAGLLP
jgi:hypothetical protein